MRIQVSLITLILIYTSATEAQSSLPPPTNVSIRCDNYGVEVHWQYPHLSNGVLFQVVIEPDIWVRVEPHITRKHSLNISSMLWDPEFNSYFVTVTAISGINKSKEAKSERFSFNKYATSKITCQLDFPVVNLSPKDGKLHLQFSNPMQLYKNSPALRNVTDSLQYDVETEENERNTFSCGLELKICETSIEFAKERKKYCINLTGLIGQRELRPTSKCYEGDIKSYKFLYSVLGAVLIVLFIAGLFLLLANELIKKLNMKAESALRKFLVFPPTQTDLCKPSKPEEENVVRDLQIVPLICIGDPIEHASSSLIELSNQDQSSDWHNTSGSSDHNCKNVRGSELEDDYSSGFNDLDKTESRMGSTSDLSAGYDCPHVTKQEMSPDDMVEVYGIY